MRFRNTGDEKVNVHVIDGGNYDEYYATAGSKKYFVLRDSDKTPLANPLNGYGTLYVDIPKGGTFTWYAKYPAPPDDVKKINYYTHITTPFEDVPIAD